MVKYLHVVFTLRVLAEFLHQVNFSHLQSLGSKSNIKLNVFMVLYFVEHR